MGLQGNDGQAAHVARMDLDEDAVENNLRYYETIRNLDSGVARTADLTHPSASGAVGPEVSHYDAVDSGASSGKVVSKSRPAQEGYVVAPRAEAAPAGAPSVADLRSRDVAPTQLHRASKPQASATAHHKSLAALPMTRAEAAAGESTSGEASSSETASAPVRNDLVASLSPQSEPAKPIAHQPAVPALVGTDVTAATKRVEATPKAGPVRVANAAAKAAKASPKAQTRQHKDVLEANPIDTGVRAPAVPALL